MATKIEKFTITFSVPTAVREALRDAGAHTLAKELDSYEIAILNSLSVHRLTDEIAVECVYRGQPDAPELAEETPTTWLAELGVSPATRVCANCNAVRGTRNAPRCNDDGEPVPGPLHSCTNWRPASS